MTVCVLLVCCEVNAVTWTVTATETYYHRTDNAPAGGSVQGNPHTGHFVWLGQMDSTNTYWDDQKGVEIADFTEVNAPNPPSQPGFWYYTCEVDPEDANSGANAHKFLVSRQVMYLYVPDTVFIVDPSANYPSYPGLAKSAAFVMLP